MGPDITEFRPVVAGTEPGTINIRGDVAASILNRSKTTGEYYLLALALKGLPIWSPRSWLESQEHRAERRRKASAVKASRRANR